MNGKDAILAHFSGGWLPFFSRYVKGVKKSNGDESVGLCPFHEDHSPSLSLNDKSGTWFCHTEGVGGDPFDFFGRLHQLSALNGGFKAIVEGLSRDFGISCHDAKPETSKPHIVATYDYTDEAGKLLFQAVRFSPKDFRQRRPDGKGGWIDNLNGITPVLYHLPEVLKSPIVCVTEGEKDADALRAIGITATTNPMGAGKWKDSYTEALSGKDIFILPDNDKPGLEHARKVALSLLGKAGSIRIVVLPGLPAKGDVSDWLQGYHGNGKEAELAFFKLAEAVKPVTTPAEVEAVVVPLLDSAFNTCIYKTPAREGNDEGSNGVTSQNISEKDAVANCRQLSLSVALVSLTVAKEAMETAGIQPEKIIQCIEIIKEKVNAPEDERPLSEKIREWALATPGDFIATDCDRDLKLATVSDRKNRAKILERMMKEGLLDRVGSRRGHYRLVDRECERIDFLSASENSYPVLWPFGLEKMVETMPGNIVVVAGEPNAGKTAFLLNLARLNMNIHETHYFSSEMGATELKKRLRLFKDIPLEQWRQVHFKERARDFADVIEPDALNIVDFLEVHEDFYKVSGMFKAIHDKLKNGVAVIALQKNKGIDVGLGGARGLEKPRLYLAMRAEPPGGVLKIVKAKNWAAAENPNGMEIHFRLVSGCSFRTDGGWKKSDK